MTEESPEILLANLTNADATVRLDSAIAYARHYGDHVDEVLPVLIGEIESVDEERVMRWQWAISAIKQPAHLALANKALEPSLSHEARALAVKTIAAGFGLDDLRPGVSMAESLLNSPSPVGEWASVLLAKTKAPVHTSKPFLSALASIDKELLEAALYAMHSFEASTSEDTKKLKRAILPLMKHADSSVRGVICMFVSLPLTADDLRELDINEEGPFDAAISQLCRMKSPPIESLDLLIRGLCGNCWDTSQTRAPIALLRMGEAAKTRVTEVAFNESISPRGRQAALRVLSQFGGLSEGTIAALQKVIEADDSLAPHASVALANSGISNAVVRSHLIQGLRDDENKHFIAALWRLPHDEITPLLIAEMKAADEDEKGPFIKMVGEFGRGTALAAQALVNEFENEDVDANALANALADFGPLAIKPIQQFLETHDDSDQISALMEAVEFLGGHAKALSPLLAKRWSEVDENGAFAIALALPKIDPDCFAANEAIEAQLCEVLSPDYATWAVNYAAQAICSLKTVRQPTINALTALLEEEEFQDRAACTLGTIGPAAKTAVAKLVAIVNSACETNNALSALALIDAETALPHLFKALQSPNWFNDAIEALVGMHQFEEAIADRLLELATGPYRLAAIEAMQKFPQCAARFEPKLVDWLKAPDLESQLAIIETLGELKIGGEVLLRQAQSSDVEIRNAAISALGGPKPAGAETLLLRAARSDDVVLAQCAYRALQEFGQNAPSEFIDILQDRIDNKELVWPMFNAVEAIGNQAKSLVPKLIEFVDDAENRTGAIEALAAIGPDALAATPKLEELLRDYTAYRAASRAIFAIAPQRAQSLRLLED